MTDTNPGVRLDKWLWAARFFKTRSLAKTAIEGGKVHYNRSRCKPSRVVEVGATVRMQLGWDEKTVIIRDIHDKRQSAPQAQALYEETEESIAKREQNAQQRKNMNLAAASPHHRPNKKQRRDLIRLKSHTND